MKFSFNNQAAEELTVKIDLGEGALKSDYAVPGTKIVGSLAGKRAQIKVVISGSAKHKYSNGIMGDGNDVFDSEEVEINGREISFQVPKKVLIGYNYQGKYLNIVWRVELFVEGELIKRVPIEMDDVGVAIFPLVKPLMTEPLDKVDSEGVSVWKIFLAFPWWKKLFLFLVIAAFGAFVTFFVLVQQKRIVFLFAESFSLFGTFFTLGLVLFLFTHADDFLKAKLVFGEGKIGASSVMKARELFEAKALVDLRNLTVLVRGQSVEKGKFKSGNRHGNRITSFYDGVNDLIIMKQQFPLMKRGSAIQELISKDVDFGELYKHISPKMEAGSDYGVDFQVTVEFWTPDYPDLILSIPRGTFEEPLLKK